METMLITKLVRTEPTRADLYAKGHKYPDLKLFDLADLADVGIAFEELPIGQEIPVKFMAYYEESAKTNQAGNPYKDVVRLEAIGAPASAASTDRSALVAELRTIRGLLQILVDRELGLSPEDLDELFPAEAPETAPPIPPLPPDPRDRPGALSGACPGALSGVSDPADYVAQFMGDPVIAHAPPARNNGGREQAPEIASLEDLLEAANRETGGFFTSTGHVIYGVKKMQGTWTVPTTAAEWRAALQFAIQYHEEETR